MGGSKVVGGFVALLVLVVLDAFWLGLIMRRYWDRQIHSIQRAPLKVRWPGALLVYGLLVVGIMVLVLPLVDVEDSDWIWEVWWRGTVAGLVIYGVYDGTMYATLKDFQPMTAAADVAWGGVSVPVAALAAGAVLRG